MNTFTALASAAVAAIGLAVTVCGWVESSINHRAGIVGEQRFKYDATRPRGKRWQF